MATENTLAINLHKSSASKPWVVVFEAPSGLTFEVSVGEDGNMAAGPRLQELLWEMDKKVVSYPTTYDMQHIGSIEKRTMQTRFMANKPVYSDVNILFQDTARKEFNPIQMKPFEEQVNLLENQAALRSVSTPARQVMSRSYTTETKLIEEHPEGTQPYWIVMSPSDIIVKNGGQISGYITGFIWPENEEIPTKIGNYDISSAQSRLTIDYLGLEPFGTDDMANRNKAKFYAVESNVLTAAGKEAMGYNENLINNDGLIAISLQYNRKNNKLVTTPKGSAIGEVYSTKYRSFEEVQYAVEAGHLRGININKSLLREKYSGSNRLKESVNYIVDVPLVEFTGFDLDLHHFGLKVSSWASQYSLQRPPNQATYDEMVDRKEQAKKTNPNESLNDMMENAAAQIIKQGSKRVFEAPKEFIQNDLKFVPAKDDRLEAGYLYRTIAPEEESNVEAMPYDYTHKVRIGDAIFEVPPLSIQVDKQFKNQKMQGMRSKSSMQSQVGYTKSTLTLELYFHDLENINGREVSIYEEQLNEKGQDVVVHIKQDEKETEIIPVENLLRVKEGEEYETVKVTRIVDGDTFAYEVDGKEKTVRLILVDTPETAKEGNPAQPVANAAMDLLSSLILNEEVYLEKDASDVDVFDRELRYVYLPTGESVQGELVAAGMARVAPYEPDTKYLRLLRRMEAQAVLNEQGIWAYKDYVSPTGYTPELATLKNDTDLPNNLSVYKTTGVKKKLHKNIVYYMDGLRSLIAQFKKTPFLPIDNEYINEDLQIHNVALRDIQVQTVDGFPEALHASLVLDEIDVGTYLMGEQGLGELINYPLMRWFYQDLLQEPDLNQPHKNYLPKMDRVSNDFTFSIIDKEALENRTNAISQFRSMKIPSRYADDFYNTDKNENAQELIDSEGITRAFKTYEKFIDIINNGVIDDSAGINISKTEIKNYKNKHGNYVVMANYDKEDFGKITDLFTVDMKRADVNKGVDLARALYGVSDKDYKKSRDIDLTGTFVPNVAYAGQPNDYNLVLSQLEREGTIDEISGGNPGFFIFQAKDVQIRNMIEGEIRSWGAEVDDYIAHGPKKQVRDLYIFPASNYQSRNTLELVRKLSKTKAKVVEEVEKQVDDYTFKYNALAAEINRSESEMPMIPYNIQDLIPMNLTVGLKNNFSEVQVQQAETPSLQYFGASEPQIALTFETDNKGVQDIESLFRKIANYSKTYRDGLVSGFLDIHNPLINMFGIGSVIPDTIQYGTVPNQPGRFIVNLTFLGFDKTQRRQEALYGFAGGKPSKNLRDLAYDNYDPTVDSLYVDEKMRQMELYPDLSMPKVSELEEVLPYLNAGIEEWEDYGSGQVYLDPDFYVSTENTFRNYLKGVIDGKRDTEFEWTDGEGFVVQSNLEKNEFFNMEDEMYSEFVKKSENTDFSDPETEWVGWRDSAQDNVNESSAMEHGQTMLQTNVTEVPTPTPAHTDGETRDYLSGKYKNPPAYNDWLEWTRGGSRPMYEKLTKGEEGNPTDAQVWYHLADLILELFPDIQIDSRERTAIEKRNSKTGESNSSSAEAIELSGQSLIDIYTKQDMREITWADNKKFFQMNFRSEAKVLDLDKSKLANGLESFFMDDHGDFKRTISASFGLNDKKMSFMRILTQLKSVMTVSSGWKQFSGGEPHVSAKNAAGFPSRVGIMGIPIHNRRPAEIERLMWDWKYNMRKSVEDMVKTYKKAKDSPFYELEIRRLDWAIASHSGDKMPDILTTGNKDDDMPIGENNSPIAPEGYQFYNQVYMSWLGESQQNTKNIAPSIYMNGSRQIIPNIFKLYNNIEFETGEDEEAAIARMVHEENAKMNNNLENWTLEKKVRGMFIDMYQHDQTGRLLRAFPSFALQLIDEGKWYGVYRTWDNFYGYNALNSIDVYKSRKVAADTAVIEMSNIYGGLTGMRNSQVNHDLRMPAFFSSHYWEHYVLGSPTEEVLEERAEIYDSILLETGARVNLRMGYGSDARFLPTVFNGTITEIETGDIITMTAQGDGLELTNAISGDVDDSNKGLFHIKEPSTTIGRLMTQKGNWLEEMINATSKGIFFKDNPQGIAHFGSVITAESGNYNPFSSEFGESMQNVYSTNGQMTKEQWKQPNGEELSVIDMYFKPSAQALMNSDWTEFTGEYDEDNIGVKLYGTSPWEIIQTFALCSTDYIAAVFPFEMRSSLFFGKPHWPVTYRYSSSYIYDEATGKMRRVVDHEHQKTYMQAHIYNSMFNIISNDVKTSAEGVFNNVVVNYDGRTVGPVQADSDIRYDRQTTAHVEANIIARTKILKNTRNYYTSESQAQKYAHSTVRDFMKDMYKGSYTVIGDSTVKPYDMVFMNDGLHDMQGIHLVKAVHHSMNGQDGFISIIEPDAYVVNFDADLIQVASQVFTISKSAAIGAFAEGAARGFGLIMPVIVSKLSSGIHRNILTMYNGFASKNPQVIDMANKIARGTMSKVQLTTYNMYASAIDSHKLAEAVQLARRATDHSQKASMIVNMKQIRAAETADILRTFENSGEGYKFLKGLTVTNKTTSSQIAGAALKAQEGGNITMDTAKAIKEVAENLDDIDKIYDTFATSASIHNVATGAATATKGVSKVRSIAKTVKAVTGSIWFKIGWQVILNLAISAAISGLREMWTRKKQDAQCVIVFPMEYKGGQMTAAMNGRRGAVYGDDPSLNDRIMNAEFGGGDTEVNEIWWSVVPKFLNLF